MKGRYGIHGGQYIPETLMSEIHKIEEAYELFEEKRDGVIKVAVRV